MVKLAAIQSGLLGIITAIVLGIVSLKSGGVVIELGDRSLDKWYEIAPISFIVTSCFSFTVNCLGLALVN